MAQFNSQGEALFEEQEIGSLKITQNVIAGKCKLSILWYLSRRSRRCNELQRLLLGVSNAVLKRQLRELEEDGMVHREVRELVPPKVVYSLTIKGESFIPVLNSIRAWSEKYMETK